MFIFIKKIYTRLRNILLIINYLFFVSKKRKKKFTEDFHLLLNKFYNGENFAYSRFSDGELFILQNKKLIISDKYWILGEKLTLSNFSQADKKEFIPERDFFYRAKLLESLISEKKNYFKGISCTCCNGKNAVAFMKSYCKNFDLLTFCNLLQNGNYKLFLDLFVKKFADKEIVLVANKNFNIDCLPFKIKKKFNVGYNCFINDYNLIEIISEYIKNNKISNHVFLVCASSLSNLIIHQLFNKYDNNTYLDIGSTLNIFDKNMGSRFYISDHFNKEHTSPDSYKKCYW
jgi:hypothetical protein